MLQILSDIPSREDVEVLRVVGVPAVERGRHIAAEVGRQALPVLAEFPGEVELFALRQVGGELHHRTQVRHVDVVHVVAEEIGGTGDHLR